MQRNHSNFIVCINMRGIPQPSNITNPKEKLYCLYLIRNYEFNYITIILTHPSRVDPMCKQIEFKVRTQVTYFYIMLNHFKVTYFDIILNCSNFELAHLLRYHVKRSFNFTILKIAISKHVWHFKNTLPKETFSTILLKNAFWLVKS